MPLEKAPQTADTIGILNFMAGHRVDSCDRILLSRIVFIGGEREWFTIFNTKYRVTGIGEPFYN